MPVNKTKRKRLEEEPVCMQSDVPQLRFSNFEFGELREHPDWMQAIELEDTKIIRMRHGGLQLEDHEWAILKSAVPDTRGRKYNKESADNHYYQEIVRVVIGRIANAIRHAFTYRCGGMESAHSSEVISDLCDQIYHLHQIYELL